MKAKIKCLNDDNYLFYFDVEKAYIEFFKKNQNTLIVLHTYVDNSLRGQGIGGQLYSEFINYVKEHNYHFLSSCSFITEKAKNDPNIKGLFLNKNI